MNAIEGPSVRYKNTMLLFYLLRTNTPEDFLRAACFAAFVLGNNPRLVGAANSQPQYYFVSLAHAYVETGDIDSLVAILSHASSQTNRMAKTSDAMKAFHDKKLFECLQHIQNLAKQADKGDILSPVLQRLVDLKVGPHIFLERFRISLLKNLSFLKKVLKSPSYNFIA